MSDVDLATLRAAAEAATPGPWEVRQGHPGYAWVAMYADEDDIPEDEHLPSAEFISARTDADAAYVAAANPAELAQERDQSELLRQVQSSKEHIWTEQWLDAGRAWAEVERLRAQVALVTDLADRLDDRIESSGFDPLDVLNLSTVRDAERFGYLDGVRTANLQVQLALEGAQDAHNLPVSDAGAEVGSEGVERVVETRDGEWPNG